ncbi:cytochrome P450 [Blakeslea trispora]|nr:cytochrome P450 [Blakeslea trispora]
MSSDNRLLQALSIAGITTTAIVGGLSLKYHDRPLFCEHPKGIPYRKGVPILGTLPYILKNLHRIHDYTLEGFEESDSLNITTNALGSIKAVVTIDPQNVDYILKGNFENYLKGPKYRKVLFEILGNGIFNANGEQWRYQRKTASHIFNIKNFRDDFTDVFVEGVLTVCDKVLDEHAKQQTSFDFQDLMFRFTMDSFVNLGFGKQLNCIVAKEKTPFAISFDYLQNMAILRFVNPFSPIKEKISEYLTPWKMKTADHLKVIDVFAKEVITARREEIAKGNSPKKDLLSRFMNFKSEKGESLNDEELRDTILNFIIAGRDTTAQALSWLFYNLALQPRIEEKIMEEIDGKITEEIEKDNVALYEVVTSLPYIHAVFFETLRLHPPVPVNQKYALKDDVWPDGTVIKAGQYVNWSPYSQGRSTKVWGINAKDFYPERWLDEDGRLKRESASKWPAFHVGPRTCLGQNLATLEALVCLCMLLRRYRFELVPGQEIVYGISLTLPMKNGMKMLVQKRSLTEDSSSQLK